MRQCSTTDRSHAEALIEAISALAHTILLTIYYVLGQDTWYQGLGESSKEVVADLNRQQSFLCWPSV